MTMPEIHPRTPRISRRAALRAGSAGLAAIGANFFTEVPSADAGAPGGAPAITHGPFLGHVSISSASVWCRFSEPGRYTVSLFDGENRRIASAGAPAAAENDLCVVWKVAGLKPDTRYAYRITAGERTLAGGDSYFVRAARPDDDPQMIKLGLGSCAWDKSHPVQPVWTRMQAEQVDAIVLMGDTPYIDSTELAVQRQRYREFYAVKEMAPVFRSIPFYAVWDDHDFGPDDALGTIVGKTGSRQAFLEYHANPSYGTGTEGIYTKFRRGPVEVFLLDPRWFSDTAPSPFDASKKTLLGKDQWEWLRRGLRDSTAPFKLLVNGMIWNAAAYPKKKDYWMAWPHERAALFRFLGEHRVSGVVLIAGDIHRSRVMRHPVRDVVGYDLTEFISSPLAENVAPYNNIPSPDLVYDAELAHSFLLIAADSTAQPPRMTAQFVTADGKVHHAVSLTTADLAAKSP